MLREDMKNRIMLIFVFAALVFTVTSCQADGKLFIYFTNGSALSCQGTREYFIEGEDGNFVWSHTTYQCGIPCPDGSVAFIQLAEKPALGTTYDRAATITRFCGQSLVEVDIQNETINVSPTPNSSELPAIPSVPVAVPASFTAHVTACAIEDGFINFTLSEQSTNLSGIEIAVTINNFDVKCNTLLNNKNLLTCTLPQSINFPALVIIKFNGIEVSNFSYDGIDCNLVHPSEGKLISEEDNQNPPSIFIFPSPIPSLTLLPTQIPTQAPTQVPTQIPTQVPTQIPTLEPTQVPTQVPTQIPTQEPTQVPTQIPTQEPTQVPTQIPTEIPTEPSTEEP